MAEYGVKIFNDQGSVQIDSKYRNIVHLSSQLIDDLTSQGYVDVVIDDTKWYVFETLMFSVDRYTQFLFSNKVINGIRRKTVRVFTDCRIHVFGYPQGKSSLQYGLRVYDDQSRLVFDSGFIPFRVLDRIQVKLTNDQINTGDDVSLFAKRYPTIRNRVGVCISRNIQVSGQGYNQPQRTVRFNFTGGDVVRAKLGTIYYAGYDAAGASTTQLTGDMLSTVDLCVVDCSGLPYP